MWAPDWWRVPMAPVPSPPPVWPMPGVAPKFWERSFGYKRPSTCSGASCKRWHCGADLIRAPGGAEVVASEEARVVAVDRPWSIGSVATFLRTETLFLVYGGLQAGSSAQAGVTKGDTVAAGQRLGTIHTDYKMLHFETYTPGPDRTANSRWWKAKPPPEGLLNPLNYVQVAAGQDPTMITPVQRHEALARLGFYAGPTFAPWSTESKLALASAQASLGVGADGAWGPVTEKAIRAALAVTEQPDVVRRDNGWWTPTRRWQLALGAVGALGFAAVMVNRRTRR